MTGDIRHIEADETQIAFTAVLAELAEASIPVIHPAIMVALLARFAGKLSTLAANIEYDDLEETALMNFRKGFHDASERSRKAAN